MSEVIAQVDKLLQNDVADRHTYYQLRFFVLGGEPTVQAKLQCCLRELKSRRLSIDAIGRELEEVLDQSAITKNEIDRVASEEATDADGILLTDHGDIERFERDREMELRGLRRRLRNAERQAGDLQSKLKNLMEECQFFVGAFRQLEQQEPLRPWDDIEVQKEYWDAKLKWELETRLMLGQPLDAELVRAIESLHDEAETKQAVARMIETQRRQVAALRQAQCGADGDCQPSL